MRKKKRGKRQSWGSGTGVVLAVAGSAVGLGNFLRFPVQAAQNGGGAFMIPYFIALVVVGIPLMWIEWTAGRFGGGYGHGTAPGIFHSMIKKNKFIKYFGVIGIFGPAVIFIYYTYIESWLLGFTFLSLTHNYMYALTRGEMADFFNGYTGVKKNFYFSSITPAYIFFMITFIINFLVIYLGVKNGIEKTAKIAMPMLFVLGVILTVRVLTLGAPVAGHPGWSIKNGLGFLWNPDFSALKSAKVWLAASGQVFFTLSVGIGVILTYASYLKEEDDVVLSGLTSASTNEFAEIIIGGSIIIPAAFVFFGPEKIVEIAQSGAFNLGFITMPMVLGKLHTAPLFSFLWFLLLFLAGVTSSISLLQTPTAFLEDEFGVTKKKAVGILAASGFVLVQPVIFFMANGVLGELDFWGGTFALVLFGTIEAVLFSWVFGIEKAWEEAHRGARLKIPGFYKFIIKYITPTFLIVILTGWFIQEGLPVILMKRVDEANRGYVLWTRIGLILLFVVIAFMVKMAWDKKERR